MDRIVVRGGPFARGQQYGRQARGRIHLCIGYYLQTFRHRAGLDWDAALAQVQRFVPAIEAFLPDALQEMRGIADGAGVVEESILALNCRSELMFAAARAAGAPPPGECTSFAVTPQASADGHMLIGQNWDWVPFARDVCVLVEVHRDRLPGYATVVEAGMLAKIGCNAAGLGLCTNTLVSATDAGRGGVPYHVMLRALLDAGSLEEAGRLLRAPERALSANYLIAHACGEAANFETIGGGAAGVRETRADEGVLAHANHFVEADFAAADAYLPHGPHSRDRLQAMRGALRGGRPGLTLERLQQILRGHDGAPNGICGHPDPAAHPLAARTTVASIIADLDLGELWIAAGPPCEAPYERYGLRESLGAPPQSVGLA